MVRPTRRRSFFFRARASNLSALPIAACAGCTGTDAGPCSPGRAVYTLEQLYLQSMVSQRTHAAIEVACADSLAFTQANPECQRLLLLAGEEAGPYNNCATPRRRLSGPLLGSRPVHSPTADALQTTSTTPAGRPRRPSAASSARRSERLGRAASGIWPSGSCRSTRRRTTSAAAMTRWACTSRTLASRRRST